MSKICHQSLILSRRVSMSIVVIVTLLLSIPFVFKYLKKAWIFYRKISTIPSPPKINQLVGHYPIIKKIENTTGLDSSESLFQLIEGMTHIPEFEKKGIFTIWLGPMPAVIVTRPEVAEVLLRRPHLPKSFTYNAFDICFGKGLINSNGIRWKSHRKLLTPAFDFKILDNFIPIMSRSTEMLANHLEDRVQNNDGLVTDMTFLVSACAFNILCETAVGVKREADSLFQKIDKALVDGAVLVMERMLKPWLLNDFLFSLSSYGKELNHLMNDILTPYSDAVYQERKAVVLKSIAEQENKQDVIKTEADDNNNTDVKTPEKPSFIDILIRENLSRPQEFTEHDIQSEFRTFLSAGYETSAAALAWTLFLIGHHQDVQEKIAQEVDSIFCDDASREMTMSDLRQMKYIEAVIKESHRLYAPVPMFARDADADIEVIHDDSTKSIIPEGTMIIILPYFVHRCLDHWDEPERFKPERFLFAEESQRRHPYSYIPFSAGPRSCLGQKFSMAEEKAIVASVFRKFTLKSLDAIDKVPGTPHVSFRPTKDIRMKVYKRQISNCK